MFVVELSLKLSPMPISVQRKASRPPRACTPRFAKPMESGNPQLMDLTLRKIRGKTDLAAQQ